MQKRTKKRWEDQTLMNIGRLPMHTARYSDSIEKQSLNGDWKFRYSLSSEEADENFFAEDFDARSSISTHPSRFIAPSHIHEQQRPGRRAPHALV